MTEQSAATEQLRQVARGALLGLAGSVFAAAATFGLAVAVSRGLSPAEAGRFFTVTSLFALLLGATAFGTEAGLGRFLLRLEAAGEQQSIPRAIAWAAVPTIGAAGIVAGLLVLCAAPVAAALGLGPGGARLLGVVIVALPASVAVEVLLSATRGFGRIGPTVLVDRVVRAGLQGSLGAVVLAAGGGLLLVTTGWAVAYVVAALLAGVAALRCVRARPSTADGAGPSAGGDERRGLGRRFWGFTWPRGVAVMAQMGIQKADIVLVALLLTPVDAALYAVATRFVPLGQMAVQALQQVLQPRFTGILITQDRSTLVDVFRVTTSWSILLAWPLYLVVACAPASYLAMFGEQYRSAQEVVVVLGATMLFAVATGPVDTLLLMAGRSDLSMRNAVLALVVDLGLCVLLIPRWGITGAAVAWAVAVVLRCGLAMAQVRREFGIGPDRYAARAAALPLLCYGAPLVVGSAAYGLGPRAWLVVVAVGTAVYLALLTHRRRELSLDLLVPRRGAVAAPAPSPVRTP